MFLLDARILGAKDSTKRKISPSVHFGFDAKSRIVSFARHGTTDFAPADAGIFVMRVGFGAISAK